MFRVLCVDCAACFCGQLLTASVCPSQELLDGMDVEYRVYELNAMSEGPDIQVRTHMLIEPVSPASRIFRLALCVGVAGHQAYLGDLTGQVTVPSLFINNKHVGGYSDMAKEQMEGRLMERLKEP